MTVSIKHIRRPSPQRIEDCLANADPLMGHYLLSTGGESASKNPSNGSTRIPGYRCAPFSTS
jgi:hypothetical protein